MSRSEWEKLQSSASSIEQQLFESPEIGIVLGSGLAQIFGSLDNETRLLWKNLPGFPITTVEGHPGEWLAGRRQDKKILIQRGRAHHYEGFSMSEILFPIRVMRLLGVKTLILTNATGAINEKFGVGDCVLIKDHINLIHESPLRGPNLEHLGPRFPDLNDLYAQHLRAIAQQAARRLNMKLEEGIYVATPGPMFETPAEIRGYRTLGGDVVGMSMAPEAIAAKHVGMDILAISCVTNMAAGVVKNVALDHQDVLREMHTLAPRLERLLDEILVEL